MIRRILMTAALALAVMAPGVAPVSAVDESWLDQPLTNWNRVGTDVHKAPDMPAPDPRCGAFNRPVETVGDAHLRLQGWDLIGSYYGGWGVLVVQGAAGYDGMCRPWGYNAFVFVNGVYAGSLSPVDMNSRTDGALGEISLLGPGLTPNTVTINASYRRYTDSDALCCPSSTSDVTFTVSTIPGQAIVTPTNVSTSPNSQ